MENFHFLNFDAINKNYMRDICQELCKDNRSKEMDGLSVFDVPPLLTLGFVLLEGEG